MIKNIFLPEKIGSYYLFARRVVGFDITKTIVHACKVDVRGSLVSVEKCLEERIIPGENNYQERAAGAIEEILKNVGQYSTIHTAIDSSRVIFKKLTLPFIEREKIKKVIHFEVEPLLPFSLHEAAIDFMVVNQDIENNSSEVLVAAVQNVVLDDHLQLFAAAGVSPEVVTVDLFSLYGLYRSIPSYAQLDGDVALIDLGVNSTRIAYIHDKHLNFIRTLHKGLSSIAKMLSEEIGVSPSEAMKHIMRFGISKSDDQKYNDAIKKVFFDFWTEISFTLRSFNLRTDELAMNKILLLGVGSEVKGASDFVQNVLNVSSEQFSLKDLFNQKNVTFVKNKLISSSNIISLSVAYPAAINEDFNMRQELELATSSSVVRKQIIAAIVMIAIVLVFLGIHSFVQIRKLNNEYAASEKEAVRKLKSRVPGLDEQRTRRLSVLVSRAKEHVADKERQISLMSPARGSYLNYLLELIERIDKKSLGFYIDNISIVDDVLILRGSVRDFAALRKLEASLRESSLFNYTESQEKFTDFEAKINLIEPSEEF